jgi:hypothetical protein
VVRIAKSLAAAPKESIPTASDGLAETLAVYRFFDNEKVTLEKVLKPHVDATHRRIRKHPVVLVAQDTTELDYTGCRNRNRDAGPLNRSPAQRGFYLHPSIAFTPEGVCLGTLDAKIWARDPETFGTSRETVKSRPIEEKESYRWLEGWERRRYKRSSITPVAGALKSSSAFSRAVAKWRNSNRKLRIAWSRAWLFTWW